MKQVTHTPTLHARTSTGKTKHWFCRVVTDGTDYFLVSEAWTVNDAGEESKHLVSAPAQVKGKNIGKKNATTDREQAIFDMGVKLRKKEDEGYSEDGPDAARTFTLPMLAHKYDDKKHTLVYPVAVQPKYNGIRCLYNSKLGHWSRQGNELLKEVVAHLQFDTQGCTMDGELILPQEYTFQQTIAAIKKFDPEVSPKLCYRIYDMVDTTLTFRERWERVEKIFQDAIAAIKVARVTNKLLTGGDGQLILTPTVLIADANELAAYHARSTGAGFEGTILRMLNGKYTPGHRSKDLLKLKDMQDAEFEITGFEDGVGKDKGAIVFYCKTSAGLEFKARPEGPIEDRQRMFKKGKSYIGQKLTVRYQALSDTGIPIFPVGVSVRDYE